MTGRGCRWSSTALLLNEHVITIFGSRALRGWFLGGDERGTFLCYSFGVCFSIIAITRVLLLRTIIYISLLDYVLTRPSPSIVLRALFRSLLDTHNYQD